MSSKARKLCENYEDKNRYLRTEISYDQTYTQEPNFRDNFSPNYASYDENDYDPSDSSFFSRTTSFPTLVDRPIKPSRIVLEIKSFETHIYKTTARTLNENGASYHYFLVPKGHYQIPAIHDGVVSWLPEPIVVE